MIKAERHANTVQAPTCRCGATGQLVETSEFGGVCFSCGLVDSSDGLVDYGNGACSSNGRGTTLTMLGAIKKLYGTYERIFHFNERIALLCGAEPSIPGELWDLIEMEFDYGDFEREYPSADSLSKEDIKRICGSVRVPNRLQSKFQSTKFKRNPLRNLKRYTEKWITIKRRLGGPGPPRLHPNDVHKLRSDFLAMQRPFNMLRHNPGCPGGRNCHKSPAKCRHNIPNLNYILLQLLRRIPGKATLYRPFLPQLRTPSKVRNLDNICRPIWKYLGWHFTPVYTRKRRRITKPANNNKRPKKKRRRCR